MIENHWYVIATSADIGRRPLAVRRFDQELVLWRDAGGVLRCLEDRCPHRRTRLSLGKVVDGELQCGFHGFRFDGAGRCRHIPANGSGARIPRSLCARSFVVREARGLVYFWYGADTPSDGLPWLDGFAPDGAHAEAQLEAPVSLCRLMEANLDFAHFPFVHPNYFTAQAALVYAKDFKTSVRGDRLDMSGVFAEDTPAGRSDGSGKRIWCSILFPSFAFYPSPLDGRDDPMLVCLAPINAERTWILLRSYVAAGPALRLRRTVREWLVLKLLWRHWVYHQDQRMIAAQQPADSGMHVDRLVCASDGGVARYLELYRAALARQARVGGGAAAETPTATAPTPVPSAPAEGEVVDWPH